MTRNFAQICRFNNDVYLGTDTQTLQQRLESIEQRLEALGSGNSNSQQQEEEEEEEESGLPDSFSYHFSLQIATARSSRVPQYVIYLSRFDSPYPGPNNLQWSITDIVGELEGYYIKRYSESNPLLITGDVSGTFDIGHDIYQIDVYLYPNDALTSAIANGGPYCTIHFSLGSYHASIPFTGTYIQSGDSGSTDFEGFILTWDKTTETLSLAES